MPTEILMPALSPTMEEGTLAKWLVKEGDTVSSGDLLAEIETDKATMEFEAVDEGTIGKILVAEGTEGVKVNTAHRRAAGGGRKRRRHRRCSRAKADEASQASEAPRQTPPKRRRARSRTSRAEAAEAPAAPKDADGERIFASPLARRIAADKGLDLSQIKGSGPHGRIVKADVEGAKPARKQADAAEADAAGARCGDSACRRPVRRPKPSPRCTRAASSRRSSSTGCARPSPRA